MPPGTISFISVPELDELTIAPALHAARARRHDQDLAQRVSVPAVRAPGSNVTREPDARAGAFAWNRRSTRTEPVKFSGDPCREGCEPLRVIRIAP